MHIKRIILRGFMRHRSTDVELPDHGIVTVTGGNGSGKSSLVEGVAYGVWGHTLRGTDPWAGPKGEVAVETDVVVAYRQRNKGKVAFNWRHPTAMDPETFGTATKAQEALDALLGYGLDVWRKTAVFSSADAANFTLATDGERKRLLESLLFLSQFDDALASCRSDLRTRETEASVAERELAVAIARLTSAEEARERVAKLAAETAEPVDSASLERAREALGVVRQQIAKGDAIIRSRRGASRSTDGAAVEAKSTLRQAQQKWALLKDGMCPTCSQAIMPDLAARLEHAVAEATKAATEAQARASTEAAALDAEISELEDEQAALRRRETSLDAALRSANETLRKQERIARDLQESVDAVSDVKATKERAERNHLAASVELPVLRAVEEVLGLRGVRAQLLGRALTGLERAANLYLGRIAGPGLTLELRAFTEKKGGGIADAISLEVHGAGNGQGYRGASGGERRRIDVALLLALAEIAANARGSAPGTLFFDEVFDTLDEAGVDAVGTVLEELSQDRAILVITHSAVLASRLTGTHFSVLDGTVRSA